MKNWISQKYGTLRQSFSGTRKIFVVGTGRSGTHWLGYVLEGHPDIHVTIEKPEIFNVVKKIALDLSTKEELFPELIKCYQREHARVAKQHYADKSHPNLWIAKELAEVFPNSLFVGIQRNPYATVASMLQHNGVLEWHRRWRDFPVPNPFLGITRENVELYERMPLASQCALRWRAHMEKMEELRLVLGPRLSLISYEEMILDTSNQIKQLEQFLTLRTPIPLPEVKRQSLDRWRSELSFQTLKEIDRSLEGYPLEKFGLVNL